MKSIFPFLSFFFSVGLLQAQDSLNVIKKDSINLKGVMVVAKKRLIDWQTDKTVMNVQADLSASTQNILEVLQKAPGVTVSPDDIISMAGKAGVNVLIDGRPTQLSGADLGNYLRSITGSMVDKIELITNPSARYPAQGNAGVINIKLKKKETKGTNGTIGIGYTQSIHNRSNASVVLNTRKNKWAGLLNASTDGNRQHTDGIITRKVNVNGTNKVFDNRTTDIDKNNRLNIRSGIDFYADHKNSFGMMLQFNSNYNPFQTPGVTNILNENNIDSSLSTLNDNLYRNKRTNANFNYKYEDTLGKSLNVDIDYTRFSNSNRMNVITHFLDKDDEVYGNNRLLQNVKTGIDIYGLRIDYLRANKSSNSKFETGIALNAVNTRNKLDAFNGDENVMLPDTGRTNRFNYEEKVAAGYFSISKTTKKFEYMIGLRAEYSQINGKSTDIKQSSVNKPDTNYLNLFPSASASYQLNGNNKFILSFSRRINRPNYQSLNPFETVYDLYTREKGNPFLRPSFSYNYELKYIYRYAMQVSFGYTQTTDYSQDITSQSEAITISSPQNIGRLHNFYLGINSPLPINKWWDGYLSVTGFHNQYRAGLGDEKLNQKTFGLNFYVQQNFRLGKGWALQASSWYNAPTREAIFQTRSLGSVNFAARKTVAKGKVTIRLTVNDIFNTQRWKQTVQFANMDFSYYRKWESRGVGLRLSWNFGKSSYRIRDRETNSGDIRIKTK